MNTQSHSFEFFGIEIHDHSLWEVDRTLKVVEMMEKRGYNALILHENDLLDACTQLDGSANFGVADLRWKKVSNRLAWLSKLIRKLDAFGAKLFLEIKEPSYHDYIFEIYPELINDAGHIDPTSPVWTEFCGRKTAQILEHLPKLGGFIVNLSSPESRVSLQDYLADHSIEINLDEWLDRMIDAFYQPLQKAGKDLYVRDFAYTKDLQRRTLSAIDRKNGTVGASIKITPHDYFPRFANNAIAHEVGAPKLIEFEAFGEHMGWGLIPNCRVQEFIDRMDFVRDIKAKGAFIRISWEAITGPHAAETLSDVNIFAMAAIMRGANNADNIIQQWLNERYGLAPTHHAAKIISDALLQSWHVIAAAYWNDGVFPRHSRLPSSWQEGWHSIMTAGMGNRHMKASPEGIEDFPMQDSDIEALFKDKEQAVKIADAAWDNIRAILSSVPPQLAADLHDSFEWLPLYARKFEYATKGTVYAAKNPNLYQQELKTIRLALEALADMAEQRLLLKDNAPHSLGVLFDPHHIRRFAQSLDFQPAKQAKSA